MEKLGVYIITLRAGLVLRHFYVLISPGSCAVILSDSFEHANKKARRSNVYTAQENFCRRGVGKEQGRGAHVFLQVTKAPRSFKICLQKIDKAFTERLLVYKKS